MGNEFKLIKKEMPDKFELNSELVDIMRSVRSLRIRYSNIAKAHPELIDEPCTATQFDLLEERMLYDCSFLLGTDLDITYQ